MAQPTDKSKPSLWQRTKSWVGGGAMEGQPRGPFYGEGELGGWYELGGWEDGFQRNLSVNGRDARLIPACYASVMAFARAISQCYPKHISVADDGSRTVNKLSTPAALMRRPNAYESWPQFIFNMVATEGFVGEAFAVAIRNNDGVITSIHRTPERSTSPYIAEDGSVFYSIGANPMLPGEQDYLVPQRDVLHLRAFCPRHPLIGESPIKAAALAAGVNVALSKSQAAFFNRMSRPSGIISSDLTLNATQMEQLRAAWRSQSASMEQGGIPILAGGMKFQSLGINSQDAQLVEAQRMSIEDIARVYGVPLPIIGDLTNSTLANVEQLNLMWRTISLGSKLENIERSLDTLFGLDADEMIELDATALMRTDFAGRIDGLSKGLQSGLFTPNECREREGLSPVEHGDKPYMQQQMVELGYRPEQPTEPTAPQPAAEEVGTDAKRFDALQERLDQQQCAMLNELKTVMASVRTEQARSEPQLNHDDAKAVAKAAILKAMNNDG